MAAARQRRNTLGGVGGESLRLALSSFAESTATDTNNLALAQPWPSEFEGFKLSSCIMKGCTGQ